MAAASCSAALASSPRALSSSSVSLAACLQAAAEAQCLFRAAWARATRRQGRERDRRRRQRVCESAPLPVFDGDGDGSLFFLSRLCFFPPLFLLLLLDRPRRELDRGHPSVEGRERVAAREVHLALEREGGDGFLCRSERRGTTTTTTDGTRRRRRSQGRRRGRLGNAAAANARCHLLHARCRAGSGRGRWKRR